MAVSIMITVNYLANTPMIMATVTRIPKESRKIITGLRKMKMRTNQRLDNGSDGSNGRQVKATAP